MSTGDDPQRRLPRHAVNKLLDVGDERAVAERVGRYRLVREVGRGGMGVVYEAEDTQLGRRVALKLLTEQAGWSDVLRERFVREAQAAARLAHPNIAAVWDATEDYIAMEFVEGRTLGEVPTRAPRVVATLIRDAALAVQFAHEHGIVHRDLKPSNLMVAGTGFDDPAALRVLVMDFGLAKEVAVDSSLSATGSILGTPGFMAPEQARGRSRDVDERSDVYALGATLYACLAGCPPFGCDDREIGGGGRGADILETIRRVVEEAPQPLQQFAPDVDRDLATIAHKCLEKEPARRYPSAGALADDLSRWLRGGAIVARPPSVAYRLRKLVGRHRAAVRAAAVTIAIAALGVVPWLLQERAGKQASEQALRLSLQVETVLADAELFFRRWGGVAKSNERLDQGIAACRAFVAEHDVADAHYLLGRLLRARHDLVGSLAALDRALDLQPEFVAARAERALTLLDFDADANAVDALAAGSPARDPAWRRREAIVGLEAMVDRRDAFRELQVRYAEARLAELRGDLDEARRQLWDVLERDPTNLSVLLSLRDLEEDPERVRELASIATDLLRDFGPAYATDDIAEAVRARVAGAARGETWGRLVGFADLSDAGSAEALAWARRARNRMQRASEAVQILDWQAALDSYDLAVADWNTVIELNGDLAAAWNNRGVTHLDRARCLLELGRHGPAAGARARALADLDRAVELASDIARIRRNRALTARLHADRLEVGGFTDEAATLRQRAAADDAAADRSEAAK